MAAPSGRVTIKISDAGWKEAAALMSQLPAVIRGQELMRALNTASRMVIRRAKQLVPPPGYPGDKTRKKPQLTPLRDTITYVMRKYQGGLVMGNVIGPYYTPFGGGGNHGHLVELGHRIAAPGTGTLTPLPHSKRTTAPHGKFGAGGMGIHRGNVPPNPFMAPAWAETKHKYEPQLMKSLQRSIKRAGG